MLEFRSPVWMSAAVSNFGLLDRVVTKMVGLSDGLVVQFGAQTLCRCTLHVLQNSL